MTSTFIIISLFFASCLPIQPIYIINPLAFCLCVIVIALNLILLNLLIIQLTTIDIPLNSFQLSLILLLSQNEISKTLFHLQLIFFECYIISLSISNCVIKSINLFKHDKIKNCFCTSQSIHHLCLTIIHLSKSLHQLEQSQVLYQVNSTISKISMTFASTILIYLSQTLQTLYAYQCLSTTFYNIHFLSHVAPHLSLVSQTKLFFYFYILN